ncbi:MAG: DUF1858 domain-containing protein [Actinobacteria bacterium]|nr:DUF1858 domain-containing protein [Actinomycetota bacterium]
MMKIDLRMTVGELIESYPSVVGLFVGRRMLCVGCPARGFHMLEEVAQIHGFEPDDFLKAIHDAVNS